MRINLILSSASILLIVAGCQKNKIFSVNPSAKTETGTAIWWTSTAFGGCEYIR